MAKLKRYGKLFRIRPELKEAYQKAHDEIWPEMAQAIHDSGIRNYSIYYRADGTIFSYFEAEDAEASAAYMKRQPINEKWQTAMEPYFARRNPSILGPEIEDLQEVFHLD